MTEKKMTKEQLDRIKKAYSSGLKVQIWFNGSWKDFDIRDYSMYSEPFSKNRQYRIIGSDYADIAENRIAELEKENAELELKYLRATDEGTSFAHLKSLEGRLAQAKEIIKTLADDLSMYSGSYQKELLQAEQFLKE